MTQIPGVHVETLANPCRYSTTQIEQACLIAYQLQRGRLIVAIPPAGDQDDTEDDQ